MQNSTKYRYDNEGNLWVMVPRNTHSKVDAKDDLIVAMVANAIEKQLLNGRLTATQIANISGIGRPTKGDLLRICKYLRGLNYSESRNGAGKYFHM